MADALPASDRIWRSPPMIRMAGLAVAAAYAVFIVWVYVAQPRTLREVRGGAT